MRPVRPDTAAEQAAIRMIGATAGGATMLVTTGDVRCRETGLAEVFENLRNSS